MSFFGSLWQLDFILQPISPSSYCQSSMARNSLTGRSSSITTVLQPGHASSRNRARDQDSASLQPPRSLGSESILP